MSAISWTLVPTLAQLTLPTGSTYYLEDSDVRAWVGDGTTSGAEKRITTLEEAIQALSNATHWLGVTSTTLSDGATTNPITIGTSSVTAVNGDIVQDANGVEYIFNGNLATPAWQQLGSSVGTLKAFAYADTGDVSGTCAVTATGSVSAPTISVDSAGATATIKNPTKATVVTGVDVASPSSTQASGELVYCSVSNKVLTLSKLTKTTGDSITTEDVTVKTGDASYTASTPTFTGTSASGTITGTATPHSST